MSETIRIKYFTDKIEKLRYIDGKSDWIDLRAAEDITLKVWDGQDDQELLKELCEGHFAVFAFPMV